MNRRQIRDRRRIPKKWRLFDMEKRSITTYPFAKGGRRIFAIGIVALALFAAAGCAKTRVPLTPAQNFQLTTDQTLDVLAHANQLVEQSVTQLPAGLIPIKTQRSIVQYTEETAKIIIAAHTAAAAAQTVDQRTKAVLAALATINQLPPDIQTFLSSPQTQPAIVNLVKLIQNSVSLAQALLSNSGKAGQ